MPTPFKLYSTRLLPPDADVVDHGGRPHVRLTTERGRPVLCPLTKDGKGYLKPSKCWYFKYRDQHGTVRRHRGFTDKAATLQLAAELERKAARARAGLADPAEEHARRPLADHLKDYGRHLEAKGNVAAHNRETAAKVAALLAGCGFVFPADADAGKAAEWLAARRRDGVPADLPAGESFTPAEAAELLGVSGAAVRAAVKRLGLPASGHGKARRYPRSTVEALARNRARGCGPETANHYTRAARGFFRWMVRAKRVAANPLESLSLVNAAADVRRGRRELAADELRRLLAAARASGRSYRGLAGTDRYVLYLVAATTGFRATALANLTPADFDLGAGTPVVTLPARFAKNRKTKVQPLPADVAATLRDYLAGKPAGEPVWGGTWARDHRGAEMLRGDLRAAGIPYSTEGPDGPEYADFHSLRHSYLTLGGRSGIDLRTLQELAGHSKPELTARYSHRRLYDLAGAVDKLPALVPPADDTAAAVPLRLTGTDGAKADGPVPLGVPPGVPTGYAELHRSAPMCTFGIVGGPSGLPPQPLETEGAGASLHRPASDCTSEGDGTRTRNHRIDSPPTPRSKAKPRRQMAIPDGTGRTAGRTRGEEGEGGVADADLAALVAAWPTLPDPIKAAIKALVAAAT